VQHGIIDPTQISGADCLKVVQSLLGLSNPASQKRLFINGAGVGMGFSGHVAVSNGLTESASHAATPHLP
jgi:hypothetical protein